MLEGPGQISRLHQPCLRTLRRPGPTPAMSPAANSVRIPASALDRFRRTRRIPSHRVLLGRLMGPLNLPDEDQEVGLRAGSRAPNRCDLEQSWPIPGEVHTPHAADLATCGFASRIPGGRVSSMHEKYVRRLLSGRLAGLAIGFAQMAADPSANLPTIRPAMTEPHRPGVVHRQHPARFS